MPGKPKIYSHKVISWGTKDSFEIYLNPSNGCGQVSELMADRQKHEQIAFTPLLQTWTPLLLYEIGPILIWIDQFAFTFTCQAI